MFSGISTLDTYGNVISGNMMLEIVFIIFKTAFTLIFFSFTNLTPTINFCLRESCIFIVFAVFVTHSQACQLSYRAATPYFSITFSTDSAIYFIPLSPGLTATPSCSMICSLPSLLNCCLYTINYIPI